MLFCMAGLTASAYDCEVDGIYYNLNGENAIVTSGNYTGNVVIPSFITYNEITYSVTSIGVGAFRNRSSLVSVTIPNSVTSIGNYAFQNCSGLISVTIPNSVTSIGNYAFRNCSGLTSVNIPNSVTSIGNDAFYGCNVLTSITIPNSVTSIGNSAFFFCNGLTSVTLNCNAVVSKNDFSTSSSLKDIFGLQVGEYILSEEVTSIGNYAFFGCNGLTSITIPNSVTSIGNHAFYDCI